MCPRNTEDAQPEVAPTFTLSCSNVQTRATDPIKRRSAIVPCGKSSRLAKESQEVV